MDFLRIETGRYSNYRIERNLCICTFCNTCDIEDEYHFISICPLHIVTRKQSIRQYFYVRPSVCKFTELLSCDSKTDLSNLGKYI